MDIFIQFEFTWGHLGRSNTIIIFPLELFALPHKSRLWPDFDLAIDFFKLCIISAMLTSFILLTLLAWLPNLFLIWWLVCCLIAPIFLLLLQRLGLGPQFCPNPWEVRVNLIYANSKNYTLKELCITSFITFCFCRGFKSPKWANLA